MAQLEFDFHARTKRVGTLALGVALVGAVALGWTWRTLDSTRSASAGLALQIAALEQASQHTASLPASADNDAQARIAAQLAYSWQPAFDALAAALSDKIALVSLDALQDKSQLKLVAEARRLADAVEFIDALQQQPGVKRASLLQHEVQTDADQQPVRFNIVVEMSP